MRSLRAGIPRCPFKPTPVTYLTTQIRSTRHPALNTKMEAPAPDDYQRWTKDKLIERLRLADIELRKPHPKPLPRDVDNRKRSAKIDPANYHTRFIALKLAYLGKNYSGFEFTSCGSLPSVEEELYKALVRTCLIFPKDEKIVDFGSCDYSKCGRTDRGVSAFGQVIGITVRSARPVPGRQKRKKKGKKAAEGEEQPVAPAFDPNEPPKPAAEEEPAEPQEPPPFDDIKDELAYTKLLNRVLPKDIRILAWCPHPPPDFSARFSCREREYRYFFTNPCFNPPSASQGTGQPHAGWLDIEKMRDAAKRFEGSKDFRNFCKVDPQKNITSWVRRIMEADIYEADGLDTVLPHLQGSAAKLGAEKRPYPKVYYFRVRGNAFLWHQIRHMVAMLFHVGQGLEMPDIIDKLLDPELTPGRPTYTMADEIPLVLWDCKFGNEVDHDHVAFDGSTQNLEWIHVDDDTTKEKTAMASATDEVWRLWREVKMDEILANGFLRTMARDVSGQESEGPATTKKGEYSVKRFEGGNGARPAGRFVSVMNMEQMAPVTVQQDRFAQKKGFENFKAMQDVKMAKFGKATEDDVDE